MALCLAAKWPDGDDRAIHLAIRQDGRADYLATSRPTAVNLFWALDADAATVGVK